MGRAITRQRRTGTSVRRTKVAAAAALLVATAGLLAGCGDDSGDSSDEPSDEPTENVSLADSCPEIEDALPADKLPRHDDWTDASNRIGEISKAGDDETQELLKPLHSTLEAYISYPEMSGMEFQELSSAFDQRLGDVSQACADADAPIFQ